MAKKPGKGGTVLPPSTGRKKGSKNKFTTLKQAFLDAFIGIGGTEELKTWAKDEKNRAVFYQMVAKLLPKEVDLGERASDSLRDLLDQVKGSTRGLPNRTQGKIRQ